MKTEIETKRKLEIEEKIEELKIKSMMELVKNT